MKAPRRDQQLPEPALSFAIAWFMLVNTFHNGFLGMIRVFLATAHYSLERISLRCRAQLYDTSENLKTILCGLLNVQELVFRIYMLNIDLIKEQ